MRQAAVVLCSVGVSALLTWHLAQSSGEQAHSQRDIIAAHMRSLVQESPTQIASSDRHTVKPWFTGRIDFAPPVKDLAANDFPLVGGRLDIVGERRVAAVVYKRRQHIINVFMWPASSSETSDLRTISSKGYNILSWTAGGTTYWAVSDLNAVEMGELQKLL
jgi:anti-sigma factor RsiW